MPDGKNRLDAFWRTIAKLEARRKSRIYCIIHCDEPDDHICGRTFWSIFHERTRIKDIDTLELLVFSPGGSADIAYQCVRFFRHHCKKLNIIVPFSAKSAATLMCLGADAIYMSEFADLGPIDVQITNPLEKGSKSISPLDEFKSAEFLRDYAIEVLDYFTLLLIRRSGMSVKEAIHESVPLTAGLMRPLYEQIDPLEIGEYKRALSIGEEYANRLLRMTKNPRQKEIVEALVSKYPSHGFVIDRTEARQLGLPVHSLDARQETLLLTALHDIMQTGESVHGFAKIASSRQASKPSSKNKPGPLSRPEVVAAAR